jgi:hypothetical protein
MTWSQRHQGRLVVAKIVSTATSERQNIDNSNSLNLEENNSMITTLSLSTAAQHH